MSKATIGAGNVEFNLAGESVTLRPTLRAAQTISRQSGGILGAMKAVGNFDLDVVTSVIALGLNKTKPREIEAIAEQVWETGLTDLIAPVTTYLSNLANGGRPTIEDEGGEGEQNPPGS